jgi:hypothetical protein
MQNREESRQKGHDKVKEQHFCKRGKNIIFGKGGESTSFLDQNINP